jgi:hypothetical protein
MYFKRSCFITTPFFVFYNLIYKLELDIKKLETHQKTNL